MVGSDTEMRGRPDGLAIAEQDSLRRLVPDTEPQGRFVRNTTMALHGDQLVRDSGLGAFDVRPELIERLAADAARAAVFEHEHGPLSRFGDGGLELVDIRQMVKWHH